MLIEKNGASLRNPLAQTDPPQAHGATVKHKAGGESECGLGGPDHVILHEDAEPGDTIEFWRGDKSKAYVIAKINQDTLEVNDGKAAPTPKQDAPPALPAS